MAAMIGVLGAAAAAQAQTTGLDRPRARPVWLATRSRPSASVRPESVAERYAGQGDAMVDYLAGKIRGGGRGAWGAVPMPAQTQVSAEDARQLAEWILSLAPAKQ